MKKCRKCGELKPSESFYACKNTKDGLHSYCKTCFKAANDANYRANSEKVKRSRKARYAVNKEKTKAVNRAWALANPKNRKSYQSGWRRDNKDKTYVYGQKWRSSNPDKVAAKSAKRRAAKLKRTPTWLTDSDWIEINWAYKIASDITRETGIEYQVDHIIPLQGEIVSGLHVPWNLQILQKSANASKGNRLILKEAE